MSSRNVTRLSQKTDTVASDAPKEWRPTWREPKKRRNESPLSTAIARAREATRVTAAVLEPLPAPSELYERSVRVLLAIAEDEDAQTAPRVGAARTLAELATRGKVGGADYEQLSEAELVARREAILARWAAERGLPVSTAAPSEAASPDGDRSPIAEAAGGADSGEVVSAQDQAGEAEEV